ncbi:MAG: hypothetical protein MI976_14655 [Pseudomonadales bacterium]|nr:hypothetical protein [Pseudomonadales bacterium]
MNKNIKGQAIVAGMALLAVAGIVFFFVFNSTRAVNEKVALVNAADATAYSGAQIAARQLNFMAYTNRVMVANEVAIGHMVSYQAEVETITDGLANMGGIVGGLITTVFNFFGAFVGVNDDSAAAWAQNFTRGFSGAYVLGVSANNAVYSEFINTEYDALLGINGQEPIIENAMSAVASQYVSRPSVTIAVNSAEGLEALESSTDPSLREMAVLDVSPEMALCQLIVFATPAAPGDGGLDSMFPGYDEDDADDEDSGPMFGRCNGMINGGADPSYVGSKNNPVNDAGIMLGLLQRSSAAVSSSEWITDRNVNYDWAFGWDARRRGATTVEWDGAEGRYNWAAGSDSINVRSDIFGLLFSMNGGSLATNTSNDIASQASMFDAIALMRSVSMCDDIDCDTLAAGDGHQMIQSYPRLNPYSNRTATIAAVLTQTGRCNDEWGVDELGNPVEGFQNDLSRFGNPCEDEASITAVSRAEVYYETPGGAASESANLFNPYWNARLAN